MSTRSSIAIKRKDGTIESIYCHSDGYLEYNGALLNQYYKDPNKINNLINLGDISCLAMRVNPDPTLEHKFEYDKRQENVVVAYGRDRDEKNVKKKIHKNIDDYKNYLLDSWQEYAYLYDEENKKWLWSPIPYENAEEMEFTSLEEKLTEMDLIEYTEDSLDKLIDKDITFSVNFDREGFYKSYESYEDAYYDIKRIFTVPKGLVTHIEIIKDYQTEFQDYEDISKEEMQKLWDLSNDLIKSLKEYLKENYNDYYLKMYGKKREDLDL